MGVERADKRRPDEMRVEVGLGLKESFKKTLMRSSLEWAGHFERMIDKQLATRAASHTVEGKGRPKFIWGLH